MSRMRRKIAIITLIISVISNYYSDMMIMVPAYKALRTFSHHLGNLIENSILVVLAFAGLFITRGQSISQSIKELGLKMPIGRAMAFGLIATLPMSIGFALTSNISPTLSLKTVFLLVILFPFIEELFYRGYVFRQLLRRAGWRFGIAVIVPTLIFSLGHWYQAEDVYELSGVLAITGLGSLLFCWIFMKWSDNLWAAFSVHMFMNLWWEVFAVDTNALGDWFANAVRFASVGLCILLTIFKDRIWKPLPIESANLIETNYDEDENAPDIVSMTVCRRGQTAVA